MTRRYKSVDIAPEFYEDFTRLADQYGLTNKALLEAMISYFKATKADPRDAKADNPTDAIKALDKRLISFIRQQEKQILKPMHDNMAALHNNTQADMQTINKFMKLVAEILDERLLRDIRLSNIRAIGGAIRPDLLNDNFKRVYETVKDLKPGEVPPTNPRQP
ncbi:BfmA/BtgA family mobilization protein [Spirosoma koreense]